MKLRLFGTIKLLHFELQSMNLSVGFYLKLFYQEKFLERCKL